MRRDELGKGAFWDTYVPTDFDVADTPLLDESPRKADRGAEQFGDLPDR
jgi:hypothetical protein